MKASREKMDYIPSPDGPAKPGAHPRPAPPHCLQASSPTCSSGGTHWVLCVFLRRRSRSTLYSSLLLAQPRPGKSPSLLPSSPLPSLFITATMPLSSLASVSCGLHLSPHVNNKPSGLWEHLCDLLLHLLPK